MTNRISKIALISFATILVFVSVFSLVLLPLFGGNTVLTASALADEYYVPKNVGVNFFVDEYDFGSMDYSSSEDNGASNPVYSFKPLPTEGSYSKFMSELHIDDYCNGKYAYHTTKYSLMTTIDYYKMGLGDLNEKYHVYYMFRFSPIVVYDYDFNTSGRVERAVNTSKMFYGVMEFITSTLQEDPDYNDKRLTTKLYTVGYFDFSNVIDFNDPYEWIHSLVSMPLFSFGYVMNGMSESSKTFISKYLTVPQRGLYNIYVNEPTIENYVGTAYPFVFQTAFTNGTVLNDSYYSTLGNLTFKLAYFDYDLFHKSWMLREFYYLITSYVSPNFVNTRLGTYGQGYNTGYDEGYNKGLGDKNDAYWEGRYEGYEYGYSQGNSDGYHEGYDVGNNDGYKSGYNEGYDIGYDEGNNYGYNYGHNLGYNDGYEAGSYNAEHYTFLSLIGAVVDAPLGAFKSMFDFDILGVNMTGFLLSLFSISIILVVIKIAMGK